MASWITGAAARRYSSSTLLVHRVASRRHTSTTTFQSAGTHSCPNPAPPLRFPLSDSPRLIRRELSSLFPVHSAVSSARLVSRLAVEASFSAEGLEFFFMSWVPDVGSPLFLWSHIFAAAP